MTFLIVRSIPLSRETREAWWNAGGKFLERRHDAQIPEGIAERYDFILNLGNTRLRDSTRVVFNKSDSIIAASHPVNLRRTLGDADILPERTTKGPHWHKNGGYGGRGKVFHEDTRGDCAVIPGDSQKHIEGTEFRVISVGEVIVQAHRKEHDGNPLDGFDWHWCGVRGIATNGIIPLVKSAVNLVPFGEHTLLGWDIIVGNRPYILEANTSPGVNDATAHRIVKEIRSKI